MAKIELTAVRKTFDSTEILKGVDLDIADGEFVSLVGPSGCGKSTLLRIIAAWRPRAPARSRSAGGSSRWHAADRAQPGDGLPILRALPAPVRVRQHRSAVADASPVDAAAGAAAGLAAPRSCERSTRTTSSGRLSSPSWPRQRVAVGRAMVRRPRVFLMDEPLSNLDAKLRVHMRTEIAQLHRSLATTFVYVTHDQAEAMTMSDRIAVMMDGNVVQVGTPGRDLRRSAGPSRSPSSSAARASIWSTPSSTPAGGAVRRRHAAAAARPPPAGQPVRIGFRCESATLTAVDGGQLRGEVTHVENLGSDHLVHVRGERQRSRRSRRGTRLSSCGARRPGGHRLGFADLLAFDPRRRAHRCQWPTSAPGRAAIMREAAG